MITEEQRAKAEESNVNLFEMYILTEEDGYTCTVCGRPTTLSSSYSNRGHNLICQRCFYHKGHKKAFAYIYGKEDLNG